MRKFIFQAKKGTIAIFEVEVEIVKAMEDPSVMWLQPGEYKARILRPTIFHQRVERVVDGKKEPIMVPDVWCSHAFFDSLEEAKARSASIIRSSFEFEHRKYGKEFSEEEVSQAVSAVEIVTL